MSAYRHEANSTTAEDVLGVEKLQAWYGESHVLHGLSFSLRRGEVVALLGRNGSGRTTTLRAIIGLIGRRQGSIRIGGRETIRLAPHVIARMGVGYCPEERGIFASLSCEENLLLPPAQAGGGMSVDEIYALLPNLAERRHTPGTRLSGGEQQMLAIARATMSDPKVLILDEPSIGLSPLVVQQMFSLIETLRRQGVTILLVEQNIHQALKIADYAFVLKTGEIAMQGTGADLIADPEIQKAYMGVLEL